MKWLEWTGETPEENLACDEALLLECEGGGPEVLRCWESTQPFVVVGHGNRVSTEVNVAACARDQVPILRRCSGGGTVLQGPGCLSYALILRVPPAGPLLTISGANQFIMARHRALLEHLVGAPVTVEGITDLSLEGRKFSGNAQRRKRQALLFHGTFLLGFDLRLAGEYLRHPSRQPEYRAHRPHDSFLRNLPLERVRLVASLRQEWQAVEPLPAPPLAATAALVARVYAREEWNWKSP